MGCAFQSENNRGREMKAKMKKLIKRVEALEERMTTVDFTYQVEGIIEEPKHVNVGRYKPEHGEKYVYFFADGSCGTTYRNGNKIHDFRISMGNCYRTVKEADQALLRQQALVRVNDYATQLNGRWVADWSNWEEQKWVIGHISKNGSIGDSFITANNHSVFKPLKSYHVVKRVISEMEEDIKLAAGWEK